MTAAADDDDDDNAGDFDLSPLVLYRDGLILVLNKPFGIPVHRGPKGGRALQDGFSSLKFGLPRAPELAHRLDRDTSGCLILGRHRKALQKLGRLFQEGRVEKTYLAVVEGAPSAAQGRIDLALGRRDAARGWWMKVDPAGAPAQTDYRILATTQGPNGVLTALELRPLTGRTHQLRVHCAHMGFPILGDAIYGRADRFGGPNLHLHAQKILAPLSPNKAPIMVEAPLSEHFSMTLKSFAEFAT